MNRLLMSRAKVTVEQLQNTVNLLAVPLASERLEIILPVLNQFLENLQPLTKLELSKEMEPASYLSWLRKQNIGDREN